MIWVEKSVRRLEDILMALSAAALAMLVLVTVADVLSRYLLNSPITGTSDFASKYLLLGLFFLSVSYTLRTGGHISLDLLVRHLPRRAQQLVDAFGCLVGLVLFVPLGYIASERALSA